MFGLGADQVLLIEAVLPGGLHVRFGPTKFAPEKGFKYPTTQSVGGVCNGNPYEEDESKWDWGPCPERHRVNFDDLWFAFLVRTISQLNFFHGCNITFSFLSNF